MQSKSFFISSLIVIALVTIVTSLISVYYVQRPLLLAYGNETTGLINISNVSTNINVIIVDNNTILGIRDVIDFGTVNPGTWYNTSKYGNLTNRPWPFVIRNEGNKDADILTHVSAVLLEEEDSDVWVWAEDTDGTANTSALGYRGVDNCSAGGGCINGDAGIDVCDEWGDCALNTTPRDLLGSLNYENCADMAYVHIGINISTSESGAKTAEFYISGSQSNTQTVPACA